MDRNFYHSSIRQFISVDDLEETSFLNAEMRSQSKLSTVIKIVVAKSEAVRNEAMMFTLLKADGKW